MDNHFIGSIAGHYEKLEAWLRQKDSDFFAAKGQVRTADFHVWEMLDQQERGCLSLFLEGFLGLY